MSQGHLLEIALEIQHLTALHRDGPFPFPTAGSSTRLFLKHHPLPRATVSSPIAASPTAGMKELKPSCPQPDHRARGMCVGRKRADGVSRLRPEVEP